MDFDTAMAIYDHIKAINDKLTFLTVCKLWSYMPRNFVYYFDRLISDYTNVKRLNVKGLINNNVLSKMTFLDELIVGTKKLNYQLVPDLKKLTAANIDNMEIHYGLEYIKAKGFYGRVSLLPNLRVFKVERLISTDVDFTSLQHLETLKVMKTINPIRVNNIKKLTTEYSGNIEFGNGYIDHLTVYYINSRISNVKKLTFLSIDKINMDLIKDVEYLDAPYINNISIPSDSNIKYIKLSKYFIKTDSKKITRTCRICLNKFQTFDGFDVDYCCNPSDYGHKYISDNNGGSILYKVRDERHYWINPTEKYDENFYCNCEKCQPKNTEIMERKKLAA